MFSVLAISAIQEQQLIIEAQDRELEAIAERNAALEARLTALEEAVAAMAR